MSAGGRSLRVSGSHPNEVWDKTLSAHCSALIALATYGRAAGRQRHSGDRAFHLCAHSCGERMTSDQLIGSV